MSELKPCPNPICRCNEDYQQRVDSLIDGLWAVYCQCGMRGPLMLTRKEAVNLWNDLPRQKKGRKEER